MGTWGPAIFSDDSVCDVREQRIADGMDGKAATDEMIRDSLRMGPAEEAFLAALSTFN